MQFLRYFVHNLVPTQNANVQKRGITQPKILRNRLRGESGYIHFGLYAKYQDPSLVSGSSDILFTRFVL